MQRKSLRNRKKYFEIKEKDKKKVEPVKQSEKYSKRSKRRRKKEGISRCDSDTQTIYIVIN